MSSQYYTKNFYEELRNGAMRSAEIMVPLVLRLVPTRSVVDIGCGDGTWLAAFRKLGVEEIFGIDGEYVDASVLQIPHDCFRAVDLARPFSVGRVFDLAVSLEVGEHLPADSAAVFVECLTRLSPLVMFSAAIPFQGGESHVNEQWPDKWAALFRIHGYLPVDFIRRQVWQNSAVEWWYAQNTLLFARQNVIESSPALAAEFEQTNLEQLALVHPRQFLNMHDLYRDAVAQLEHPPSPPGVRAASRLFLASLRDFFVRRLSSITRRETSSQENENP
jgi:SAM-dependent methyltransferase